MKPFSDSITRLGRRAFNNYMGGCLGSPLYGMDLEMVAWIYGVRKEEVITYVEQQMNRLIEDQHKKYKNKA